MENSKSSENRYSENLLNYEEYPKNLYKKDLMKMYEETQKKWPLV